MVNIVHVGDTIFPSSIGHLDRIDSGEEPPRLSERSDVADVCLARVTRPPVVPADDDVTSTDDVTAGSVTRECRR